MVGKPVSAQTVKWVSRPAPLDGDVIDRGLTVPMLLLCGDHSETAYAQQTFDAGAAADAPGRKLGVGELLFVVPRPDRQIRGRARRQLIDITPAWELIDTTP